jgi:hypothetical protein
VSGGVGSDGVFDGEADLDVAGTPHHVRVRLTGHLNPVDGQYHWQGLVYGAPDDVLAGKAAQVRIGDRCADSRLVERLPSGPLMISGVGAPPYDLTTEP